MTAKRVLIVEDEALFAMSMQLDLEDLGYEIVGTAATADEAVRLARATDPDVILMDVRLKGHRDGVDASRQIADDGAAASIIFVTGSREPETLRRIKKDHAAGLLIKPIWTDELDRLIRQVT